ncbi:MAG: NAD(P)H-dependent oxidoreductase subunit E [Planctomycetota bacterium]
MSNGSSSESQGTFPPEHLRERFDGIVARYPKRVAALIPIMMILQLEERRLSPETIEGLAGYLETTPAHILGVLTFYAMFSTKKRGTKHIYFCKTTPCWLRGAKDLLALFEEKLGIKADSGETTEDGQFSLDTAECIGLCEMAPAILVDEERYGNITPEMVDEIIEELSE